MRARCCIAVGIVTENDMQVLIIIILIIFTILSVLIIGRRSFFRMIWFVDDNERRWFYSRCIDSYGTMRKSVVLYALRILSIRFNVHLISLESDVTLIGLFRNSYELTFRYRLNHLLGIIPDYKNPLQRVSDDFTVANEVAQLYVKPSFHAQESMMVKDYVEFLVEFDRLLKKHENIRCTAYLGR